MKLAVVGRGRVGRALARGLAAGGLRVRAVAGRAEHVDADVVVLAVPDAAIEVAASRLADSCSRRTVVVHCAGRLDASPLAACAARGAHVGVLHPLVSFASRTRPPALAGATLVAAGDAKVIAAARRVARALGMRVVVAPVHGSAYHAAAALVAAGGASLVGSAAEVLVALGVPERDATRALAGLLATVAANVAALGPAAALTGPVARGDDAAVAAHRAALAAYPEVRALYDAATAAARRLRR